MTEQLTLAELRLLARVHGRAARTLELAASSLAHRQDQERRQAATAPYIELARAAGLDARYVPRHPQPSPDRWCRSLEDFAWVVRRWQEGGRRLRTDPMWLHCDGAVASWRFGDPHRRW